MSPWFSTNEHGVWCCACGELLSHEAEPFDGEECPTCGAPDDVEQMAQYFAGEDEDDDDECPTCHGRGIVNPLTAPPGFFCVGSTDCPHCDGTGRFQ